MYQAKTIYNFGCELIPMNQKELPGYKWYTIKGTKKNLCLANSAVSAEEFTTVRKFYGEWTELIFHFPSNNRLLTVLVSYNDECALFVDFKFTKDLGKISELGKKMDVLLTGKSQFKKVDKDNEDFTFEEVTFQSRLNGKFRQELDLFLLNKEKK